MEMDWNKMREAQVQHEIETIANSTTSHKVAERIEKMYRSANYRDRKVLRKLKFKDVENSPLNY